MNDHVYTAGDLRVWWISQEAPYVFNMPVPDAKTAAVVLDCLTRYTQFLVEYGVTPLAEDSGGLDVFDPDDDIQGEWNHWSKWYLENTGKDIHDVIAESRGSA